MGHWKLSDAERRRLSKALRRIRDTWQYKRTLAVLKCGRGKSKSAVARLLSVLRQSIHNWISRYRRDKQPTALNDAPRSGRPRNADETVETPVQALMVITPERCGYHATHWTIPLLCDQVSKNLDRQCAEMTMGRCLHRLGYAWKRPHYVLARDPQCEKKVSCGAYWQFAETQRGASER